MTTTTDLYVITTLPSGTVQRKCRQCLCNVDPAKHEPGSEDCAEARREREWCIAE